MNNLFSPLADLLDKSTLNLVISAKAGKISVSVLIQPKDSKADPIPAFVISEKPEVLDNSFSEILIANVTRAEGALCNDDEFLKFINKVAKTKKRPGIATLNFDAIGGIAEPPSEEKVDKPKRGRPTKEKTEEVKPVVEKPTEEKPVSEKPVEKIEEPTKEQVENVTGIPATSKSPFKESPSEKTITAEEAVKDEETKEVDEFASITEDIKNEPPVPAPEPEPVVDIDTKQPEPEEKMDTDFEWDDL